MPGLSVTLVDSGREARPRWPSFATWRDALIRAQYRVPRSRIAVDRERHGVASPLVVYEPAATGP